MDIAGIASTVLDCSELDPVRRRGDEEVERIARGEDQPHEVSESFHWPCGPDDRISHCRVLYREKYAGLRWNCVVTYGQEMLQNLHRCELAGHSVSVRNETVVGVGARQRER